MSPRHFSKVMANPIAYKEIKEGMNFWFAFTTVMGIDKLVTKLFVFTPPEIKDNPVKDNGQGS